MGLPKGASRLRMGDSGTDGLVLMGQQNQLESLEACSALSDHKNKNQSLKYVYAGSLDSANSTFKFRPSEAVQLKRGKPQTRQVHLLSAIAFLHELPVVHRDVKCENVLLAQKGMNEKCVCVCATAKQNVFPWFSPR